jgi:hypothetical protein
MPSPTPLHTLQDLLDDQGLRAGLVYLNARVPHRYTAMYRLRDKRLRRLGFVDKKGGQGPDTADVRFEDSFCELAVRDGHLSVTNVASDARVRHRPNPLQIGSYVGFPLASGPGALYGSFCHFDTCAHALGDGELEFLAQASQLLTWFCLRPGMPLHSLSSALSGLKVA